MVSWLNLQEIPVYLNEPSGINLTKSTNKLLNNQKMGGMESMLQGGEGEPNSLRNGMREPALATF